ncbi:MAG: F0F1 ATP synthase subunit A [Candidatus Binataceae bacterium]|nr:F0F1 ATP synthase subunit A [Candidatus Binataceae bacterium]
MPAVNFIELISRTTHIPLVLVSTWIVMGLLVGFALIARRSIDRAADPILPEDHVGIRSISEVLVGWLDSFSHDVIGHGAREFVGFFGSLFVFILAANFFGLVPGMEPPTSDSNLTFALAIIAFGFYNYYGFRANGLGYLKSFLGPVLFLAPLMLPIEVASHIFRPVSLGIRLFANMFADHTMLGIFTTKISATRLVVPVIFYVLGSIVCIVQALIFTVLAMAYVRMAQEEAH